MRDTGPRTFKSRAASWSAAGKWVGLCARGLKKRRNNKVVKKEQYNVAVVGATGAVGEQMREVLEERHFPVGELRLLASERSAGQFLPFQSKQIRVEILNEDSFTDIDIGLFSAGASVSAKYAPIAVRAGAVVVDNTSFFRMEPDIPLVVPEVNAKEIGNYKNRGIIANPNCSTIQMVVALKPLHDAVRIKRIVVSTYQSVSGAGRKAMEELSQQVAALFSGKEIEKEKFPHQIAFNCIPHIDAFMDDGYTKEEWKLINETRKILNEPLLPITATTVRVPVFCSHSESVNVETERKLTATQARGLLREAPGIVVADEPQADVYPMAIDAVGKDATYVGRIRDDDSVANGLNLWVVADNLRKGAALNAVQIAEILIRDFL
ncbi:MAG: aspartate-semialdehyde dehydrogenase [Deltaproteobacteria bacterium]|nr:MAG: aspartate-semialdehyde dehydrogenase [Deltaproteobacteria bacterium]